MHISSMHLNMIELESYTIQSLLAEKFVVILRKGVQKWLVLWEEQQLIVWIVWSKSLRFASFYRLYLNVNWNMKIAFFFPFFNIQEKYSNSCNVLILRSFVDLHIQSNLHIQRIYIFAYFCVGAYTHASIWVYVELGNRWSWWFEDCIENNFNFSNFPRKIQLSI